MHKTAVMEQHFERQKNMQASGITAIVCLIVFLLFFFIRWTLPIVVPPPIDEGIEVNLGNSDFGSGDIQPMVPGDPAPESSTDAASTPPPAGQTDPVENTEEDNDPDAAPLTTPVKTPKATVPTPVTKPVTKTTTPAPPTPKPKATMGKQYTGGTGTGGNGADSYNNSKSQGNDASGSGDKGKPNGNPNSDNYTGSGRGAGGVSIRSGLSGRRFTKLPSFEDNFNENAKVAVDITVNKSGAVTLATINPKGTTTTNGNIRAIALRKARQLKLNAGNEEEQTGTIVFDFKVRG